jgi:hypothetical protein
VTAKVEIRPGSEADLAALVAVLGQRHWFTDRLARRHLPGVRQLTHLEGLGLLWGRGIGTALIRAAEVTARRLGHEQLALAVGVDNPGARRLDERLGYVDWDHGTIVGTWVERDHGGPPITLSETCNVLVRLRRGTREHLRVRPPRHPRRPASPTHRQPHASRPQRAQATPPRPSTPGHVPHHVIAAAKTQRGKVVGDEVWGWWGHGRGSCR